MKLYYSPGSCSLSVHISLIEAGVPFDLAKVNLGTHQLENGSDFYQISPRGYVPVLEVNDGSRHMETPVLLQYVADLAPKDVLISSDTNERIKTISWLAFISTEIHKTFGWIWLAKELNENTRNLFLMRLGKHLGEIDQLLAKQDYLMKKFTVADAYLFNVLSWAGMFNVDISHHINLAGYITRVAARPSVEKARKDEGLI